MSFAFAKALTKLKHYFDLFGIRSIIHPQKALLLKQLTYSCTLWNIVELLHFLKLVKYC
jgi:hypothetical protein